MITPLKDRVVVQIVEAPAPTTGVIAVVRTDKQPATRGKVVAVGPDVLDARVGATVVISRLQGIEVGAELLVLPESAVLGEVAPDAHCVTLPDGSYVGTDCMHDGCPQVGVGGMHSEAFLEGDGPCEWCGAKPNDGERLTP
jgi:co-chaperonin GroES (HSP10)